ncbi:hypothetical protein [Pseudorhodoplanes sp.]|uniref:hypothetical protein n=1 Tax=Pseudorhodoplanes sp. TaxID=1934341 RepID=UPI003D0EFDA6
MSQLTADQTTAVKAFAERHGIPKHLRNQLLQTPDTEQAFCDNLLTLFQLRTNAQIKRLEDSIARLNEIANDLSINYEHLKWACLASNKDANFLRESLIAVSSKLEDRKGRLSA